VYVRSAIDENIWRIDLPQPGAPSPTAATVAIQSTKQDIHPAISPDGKRIACTSTRSGSWEIWVSDLDGANALQLTRMNAPTGTGAPRWSPDGSMIAFASDSEGQFDVFLIPATGGKPRNMTSNPTFDHVPSFSRDGKWLYFSSARSGRFEVWKMPVSGGDPVQVTRDGGWVPLESADGRDLYYQPTAGVGAAMPVMRMATSGGSPGKVFDDAASGAYAVTESGAYYVKPQAEPRIEYFDFATRKITLIAASIGRGAELLGFTASFDGRSVYFARRDSAVDDLVLVENFR
jgi:Tol biopolymer transport system component